MSKTKDNQADSQKDVVAKTDDLSATLNMLSTFLHEIATYIYGIDCQECTWVVVDEENHPGFQFNFDDTEDNRLRFDKFCKDFMAVPSSIERIYDDENNVLGFTNVDEIVLFLEHFSTHRNWGLGMPLEDYFSDLPIDRESAEFFDNMNKLPDSSVLYLRKQAYSGIKSCLPELKAAFVSARNNFPNSRFTYTLDEIKRSLNAFYIKDSGARNYDCQSVFWFH